MLRSLGIYAANVAIIFVLLTIGLFALSPLILMVLAVAKG